MYLEFYLVLYLCICLDFRLVLWCCVKMNYTDKGHKLSVYVRDEYMY